MKRFILFLGTLLLSMNSFSVTTLSANLGSAIMNKVKLHSNLPHPAKIIYGGQDMKSLCTYVA
jgi:hypothetical protein